MAFRTHLHRLRHSLFAALIGAAVVVPLSGAAHPAAVPAPVPVSLAPIRAETCGIDVAERYTVYRAGIRAAERMAADHGDRRRATALRSMADPARRFLFFDGRDGGRSVESFGDLCRAERIAVLVPGADTSVDEYARFRSGAVALARELRGRAVVLAWLGYRTPGTVSPEVLTPGRADDGATALRTFVARLHTAKPAARIALLCHSYASMVCGRAGPGLDVDDIVLYGSPGAGVEDVAAMRTRATVWAGRGAGDPIAYVPDVELRLLSLTVGFGTDPVSPRFGARLFPAGDGGHSDYLTAGSGSLRNIARIVTGELSRERTGVA